MSTIRTYSELKKFSTIEERFDYLVLTGSVGKETFGFDRYLNQQFYRASRWKSARDKVIIRDEGCDLGIPGYEIADRIIVHHMNPVQVTDFLEGNESILDENYLICVSHRTHLGIHFGDASMLPQLPIRRTKGDTNLW